MLIKNQHYFIKSRTIAAILFFFTPVKKIWVAPPLIIISIALVILMLNLVLLSTR